MKWLALLFFCFLMGCSHREPVEDAKAVVEAHERYARAGDLNAVVDNVTDDIVVLTPETLLVRGKQEFREFYAWTLSYGMWETTHQIQGEDIIGDGVIMYGVVRGNLVQHQEKRAAFVNNFIFTLKYEPDGKMRFWRIAYAPASRKDTDSTTLPSIE